MTGWSLDMGMWQVITTTVLQGFGLGMVWVPLSVVSFATLPTALRTEGSAFSSLLRNIGGSVGIAVGYNVLVRNIQINHAWISAEANPLNRMMDLPSVHHIWNLGTASGLAALNAEVTRQASMIAYLDVFKLLMILTLVLIPLLLLLRSTHTPQGGGAPAALD
jgi:DHA2 family multidrug resistance protein